MDIYFSAYSDDEIEKMIERLTPLQRKIFDSKLQETNDRRHSLFFARSFSNNFKEKI